MQYSPLAALRASPLCSGAGPYAERKGVVIVNDPPESAARPRRLASLALIVLAALVAAHFAMTLAKATHIFLDTQAYSGLTAKRPFQDRLLMAPMLSALVAQLHQARFAPLLARLPEYLAAPDPLAYAVINAASFFAALLALWPLTGLVFGPRSAARGLTAALFVVLAYLLFCLNPNLSFALPYDIPALAFTVTALLLYRGGHWLLLFPLFALAALNRETILFVPVYIAAHTLLVSYRRADLWRAGGLLAILAAVKVALQLRLAHLPTEQGLRLVYNAEELLKPWQWPAIFALPLLLGCTVVAARRRLVTCDFALTALAGGVMLLTVAQITETRAFGELIPYLSFALAPLIQQALARRDAPAL